MMRTSRSVVTILAAAVAIVPASMASASSAPATRTVGSVHGVPASAGSLTQGPVEYFWQRGQAPEQRFAPHAGAAGPAAPDPGNNLFYGGGAAPGSVSTTPAVYVVFWGSQWSATDPLTS